MEKGELRLQTTLFERQAYVNGTLLRLRLFF
jgi:hypothetical protein